MDNSEDFPTTVCPFGQKYLLNLFCYYAWSPYIMYYFKQI